MLAIVKDTIEYREQNGIVRKDLLQLLMQLRNKGSIEEDDSKSWNIQTSEDGEHGRNLISLLYSPLDSRSLKGHITGGHYRPSLHFLHSWTGDDSLNGSLYNL